MEQKIASRQDRLTRGLRQRVARFRDDENGSMIVFTLFLLVLMLIVSGMAVDFMRFESRRAALQGCTDRAVLAAADLDQKLDAKAVVIDYFDKCGLAEHLKGEPIVSPSSTEYREVTANGELVLNTFFLKLIGMDTLTASSTSTAIEGVGEIEVSLVVDISGSMNDDIKNDDGTFPKMTDPVSGNLRNVRRMDRLQEAANNFVTELLGAGFTNRISISLVPYSEQVNVGKPIFDALNTNQMHDYGYCLEFADSDYDNAAFDTEKTYDQTQQWQYNMANDGGSSVEEPLCPRYDYETVLPLTQNLTALTNRIDALQPRAGTSIFLGLKWGVSLLDPSFRTVIAKLPDRYIDTAFTNRPADYAADTTDGDTKKYLVLMTDGQNSGSDRLKPEFYDTPSEIAHWANVNFPYYWANVLNYDNRSNWHFPAQSNESGNLLMKNMCDAAKASDIIIYAISLGSTGNPTNDEAGWAPMRDCASSPNFFFKTNGEELVEIFAAIAAQITDLRLTQ